jgi:AcrR family transcriptional regulator
MAITRRRILAAAAQLFDELGYRATTMANIAATASVSVQSVQLAGTKSALLLAAFEQAFAGDEGRQSLAARPALQEIMQLPVEAALQGYTDFLATANERSAGVWLAMRDAAETDADVAAVLADMLVRRHTDLLVAIAWAGSRGLLAGHTDADARAQMLADVASAESFRYYTRECGWTREEYRRWMHASITRLVFAGI